MSKFSKILISVSLIIFAGLGFSVSFSKAQGTEGTVYVCPQATSIGEVSPRCPEKIILKLGETISGLTLTATNYEGKDYYMVLGFTNGGGAVNLPPTASAGGPYNGYGGLPVTFNVSSSTDPNDDPLQYRWDFENDGIWDTEWLATSTINRIWNNDYDGVVKLVVNDGEFNAFSTTSVKIISPKTLKQEAIDKLEKIKSSNPKLSKKVDLVKRFINQSLNSVFWVDVSHLIFFEKDKCGNFEKILETDEPDFNKLEKNCPKLGIMVFYYEKVAADLIGSDQTFKEVINNLTKADSLLAEVSLFDAKKSLSQDGKFKKVVEKQIELAEKELQKANEELQKNRYGKVIARLAKSWLHSQLAIKFASLGKNP